MNLFETVKENVRVRDAVESLGLKPDRSGRVLCPFHDDRHPSMKLYDDHYYCFACGAHGDVINLAAQLTGLRPYEAAKQLTGMYGLQEGIPPSPKVQLKKQKQKEAQQFREKEQLCFSVLSDYCHLLKDWKARYPPKSMGEEPDSRFLEACHQLDLIEYRLDLLLEGPEEDKKQLVNEMTKDNRLMQLQERIRRLQREEQYVEKERIAGRRAGLADRRRKNLRAGLLQ